MLHHIEINVSNLKKSKDFYDLLLTKLGYQVFQEWENGFSYIYGDCYIVFVQTREKYQHHQFTRMATGLNHLAFSISSESEVDSLRSELLKSGVTELYPELYPHAGGANHYAFFFEDPDRIKLEIVAKN
ncbi:hypothetical protein CUS89_07640 [Enterococcus mundtii]|uniref:VOC domain-containing protein n=1 Tax=Enterococcus mundtii TaxID=53346 RepID=A0A2S7RUJ7_ENTMU|nr:hypothetical protein CUS89_07640 [Enterococcus mundtii]